MVDRVGVEQTRRLLEAVREACLRGESREAILARLIDSIGRPHTEAGGCQESTHYTVGCERPDIQLRAGDVVIVRPGAKVESAALAVVRLEDDLLIDHIYFLDPGHIRIGEGADGIERAEDVEIIGPVVGVQRKEPVSDDLEWPELIDG